MTGPGRLVWLLPVAIIALAVMGLAVGPLAVGVPDLYSALAGLGSREAELALALRAPRVLGAMAVGAGLAAAGAAYQSTFRNPLAAPDLLGVSAGAAFGAAVAILANGSPVLITAAAFAGGLAAVSLALLAARAARQSDPVLALVLCGVVSGALASAALALILWLADPYSQLPAISYWLLGSLARVELMAAAAGLVIVGLCGALLWLRGPRIDALSLGEEQARALGLDAVRERRIVVALATLAAATAVSMAGVIGWVGLLAPHAARLAVGDRAVALIPASAGAGALLVLGLDLVARLAGPVEIPLGVLTAALGAPLFLALFIGLGRR